MININCTLNCFFENEGKCTLTHVSSISSTPHPSCLFFEPKNHLSYLNQTKNNKSSYVALVDGSKKT